jgi:hypothetical protein
MLEHGEPNQFRVPYGRGLEPKALPRMVIAQRVEFIRVTVGWAAESHAPGQRFTFSTSTRPIFTHTA